MVLSHSWSRTQFCAGSKLCFISTCLVELQDEHVDCTKSESVISVDWKESSGSNRQQRHGKNQVAASFQPAHCVPFRSAHRDLLETMAQVAQAVRLSSSTYKTSLT